MNENMIVESSFVSSSEKVRGFFNLSLHSKDAVFKARKLPKILIVLEVVRPYEYRNRSLAASPNTLAIPQIHRDLEISGLLIFTLFNQPYCLEPRTPKEYIGLSLSIRNTPPFSDCTSN